MDGLAVFDKRLVVVPPLLLAPAEVVLRFGGLARLPVGLEELAEFQPCAVVVLAVEERDRKHELLLRAVLNRAAWSDPAGLRRPDPPGLRRRGRAEHNPNEETGDEGETEASHGSEFTIPNRRRKVKACSAPPAA